MKFGDWRLLLDTYVRPHRRMVVAMTLTLLFTIAMQIATPQIIRVYLDRAISPALQPIGSLTALYVVAVLVQQGFRVITAWLTETLGWITTNELRADLMEHCLDLDPTFHKEHTPGELIERIDGDLSGLSLFFSQFIFHVVGNTVLLIGVLVVVWIQSALAGAVLTTFALVALGSLVVVRRVSSGAWEKAREASAALFGFIEERLSATEDIRSLAGERHTLRGFYDRARSRLWKTSRARQMDSIPWAVNAIVIAVASAISFAVPTVLVSQGALSVGEAFALYFYTQLVVQPLNNVSHQVEQLQQAIAGGRRVLALLRVESAIADGPRAALPEGGLSIALRRVTFAYGDDPPALSDVSLDVPAGHVLGVVGRTGSGKSTLARLLVRLHDVGDGAIVIGGIDACELTRASLRERVVLVTQEVHLLRATVRDNFTFFDSSIPDDRLLHAIDVLGLGPWFARLPDGLDTVVHDGAMSAGEAQLLSFGRAFLVNPSVVVLDEASSRLDPATERILEGAVDALLRGRTGVLIAHRLSTLDRCDSIAVLEHGRLIEHGPRTELADDPHSHFGALLRTGLDVVPG